MEKNTGSFYSQDLFLSNGLTVHTEVNVFEGICALVDFALLQHNC